MQTPSRAEKESKICLLLFTLVPAFHLNAGCTSMAHPPGPRSCFLRSLNLDWSSRKGTEVKNGEKRGRERAGRNNALATIELPAFFPVEGESLPG